METISQYEQAQTFNLGRQHRLPKTQTYSYVAKVWWGGEGGRVWVKGEMESEQQSEKPTSVYVVCREKK